MWPFNCNLFRITVLIFFISIANCSFADIQSGLLWRVHKPLHPSNYLFGSIHVDDKRVKKLNKIIKRRFDESKTLCLEVLPDRETQVGIGLAMLLPKGQALDDVLGESLFNRLSLAMNRLGMTPLEIIRFKPWAAMIVLSRPESQGGYTLDEQLYHLANAQKKTLCSVETLQEQLSIFDELSHQEQIFLLEDTLNNLSKIKNLNETLIKSYLSGNLDELYRNSLDMGGGNTELAKKLRERLIDKRNIVMANRLVATLEKGGAFVAVGALHLPGENGLLQLLRDRGFIVTPPLIQVSPW